jgi:hypothetical protein
MPAPTARKVIRASDIGSYLYCRRSWWYRLQGYTPENQAAFEQGSQFHQGHGRQVGGAVLMRQAAFLLFILALVLLAAALVTLLVQ